MAGAGLGLRLHDLAYGTDHHDAFRRWWPLARREYLGLDGSTQPAAVTLYYDPLLDVHHRVPAFTGMMNTLYLAPQVPSDTRALFDAAADQAGMLSGDGPLLAMNERSTGIALLVARDWGLDDLAARLQAGCESNYEPTWNGNEFWWGFRFGEAHPRGQLNAILAAAEATAPGTWTRFANEYVPFEGPEVRNVDLATITITQAAWTNGRLLVSTAPASEQVAGRPTSFRVHGLEDPSAWTIDGDAIVRPEGADVVVEVLAQARAFTFRRRSE